MAVEVTENDPSLWRDQLPKGNIDDHKYKKGHLIVVGGAAPMSGAARLAARAGLRVGAGLVTTACPTDALSIYAEKQLSVMTCAYGGEVAFEDVIVSKKCRALVIGPGKGVSEETRKQVKAVLITGLPAVLDADALSSFEENPDDLFESLHEKIVLTPHEGEFGRLFPDISINNDRVEALKRAIERAKCTILLKGPETLIGAPDGRIVRNIHASFHLATAGSGDVLSGIIGGLMAQNLAVFEAACAASWIHGEAGIRLGRGLIAEDLVDELPQILSKLFD